MYEQFRNEIIEKLNIFLDREQLLKVMGSIDSVASRYDIKQASMELAVVGRKEMLDLVKLYFVIRSQEGMSKASVKTESSILKAFVMHCTVPLQQLTANHIRSYLYNYELDHEISKRTL